MNEWINIGDHFHTTKHIMAKHVYFFVINRLTYPKISPEAAIPTCGEACSTQKLKKNLLKFILIQSSFYQGIYRNWHCQLDFVYFLCSLCKCLFTAHFLQHPANIIGFSFLLKLTLYCTTYMFEVTKTRWKQGSLRGWHEHLARDGVTNFGGVSVEYKCPLF